MGPNRYYGQSFGSGITAGIDMLAPAPETATTKDIRLFQLHLAETGISRHC